MINTWNVPVAFAGTKEQADANFRTHPFTTDNGLDYNCMNCDCKPWHAAAEYPCGVEPARQNVSQEVGAAQFVADIAKARAQVGL